jgi:hypothetical protein
MPVVMIIGFAVAALAIALAIALNVSDIRSQRRARERLIAWEREEAERRKRVMAYLGQYPELCKLYRDSPKQFVKVAREKLRDMDFGRL